MRCGRYILGRAFKTREGGKCGKEAKKKGGDDTRGQDQKAGWSGVSAEGAWDERKLYSEKEDTRDRGPSTGKE